MPVLRPVVRWLLARDTPVLATWAVELLAPEVTDRVLELGISLGFQLAAGFTRQGQVVAVDPSPGLLARAEEHNAAAVSDGRVQFRLGHLPSLPFETGSFDRALAVNNVQFWPDVPAALTEVRRVLRPGGRMVLVVHPRWLAGLDEASAFVRGLCGHVLAAGFLEPVCSTMLVGPVPAHSLVAHSPAAAT
jgi:SAM-dependent methyltransferase